MTSSLPPFERLVEVFLAMLHLLGINHVMRATAWREDAANYWWNGTSGGHERGRRVGTPS